MTEEERLRLRKIKNFGQLLAFLRDELGWPIESVDDEDDLTFDWSDDLGLKPAEQIGIKAIKQLRPLDSKQPWGIFFIDFEKKKLPIVILRRILNALVVKRRAGARSAEQAAWRQNDLLFISAYGEEGHRELTFAHFSEPVEELGDSKPTLRVLGWDDDDTSLKLDFVAETLKSNLTWPTNAGDVAAWRKRWSEAFVLRHRQVIETAKDLALHLAELAQRIRNRAVLVLGHEGEKGPLRQLMKGFKTALIHDLDEAQFADMYAQTITYGLFSAAVSRTVPGAGTAIVQENVVDMVPVTNPFLKEMLQSFLKAGGRKGKLDFDELGIQEVVDLLRDSKTRLDLVIKDFGNRRRDEDPVIHFYEDFLGAYNKKLKVQRGVFYTPQPVVSYIVRSVHELLQTEFGLEDGLADTTTWREMLAKHPEMRLPPLTDEPGETRTISPDEPFVQILDPATGTATFMVEVIDVIYRTLRAKWKAMRLGDAQQQSAWNDYVPKHLLPRLHAFELMMAPYAIAHMKIGLKLAETGYRFGSEERARIYLTNALEPWVRQPPLIDFPALAHEAAAVNEIKRKKRFTVVIGNPPYSTSISEPTWLMRKLDDWKHGLNEAKSDLNREEWKFLRFAQFVCSTTSAGVIGLIINRDFLDGIVKRRMREHLGESFPIRIVVDLNGDVKGNIADENVFEIEQGVAIVVCCTHSKASALRFASRVGTRAQKYADLSEGHPIDAALRVIEATAPYFRWVPFASELLAGVASEYASWMSLDKVFIVKSSGIQTKNDPICIDWSASEIFKRVERLTTMSAKQAHEEFGLDGTGVWSLASAKADLQQFGISKKNVRRILYRPLDFRFTYYTHKSGGFLGRPRFEIMRHMLDGKNIGLVFNRQIVGDSVTHFEVSRDLTCHGTFYLGNKGQDYLAPLYLHVDGLLAKDGDHRTPNLTPAFTAALRASLGNSNAEQTPEECLHYIYAVFHSPSYRSRYAELLKMDFPRLPLPKDAVLFGSLAQLGNELSALHLLESPKLEQPITEFVGGRNPEIEKVSWSNETVWIDKAQTIGFRGALKAVWNFRIGGYQICEKWLKDRKGLTLSKDDIAHYHKIVVALSETIRLMGEIDTVIDAHGGWPAAFEASQPLHRPSHSYIPTQEAALLAGLVVALVRRQPGLGAAMLEQALRSGLDSNVISLTLPDAWRPEWSVLKPALEQTLTAGSFGSLTDVRSYLVRMNCLKESRQNGTLSYVVGNQPVPIDVSTLPEHERLAELLLVIAEQETSAVATQPADSGETARRGER